jgi:hypothetical protein
MLLCNTQEELRGGGREEKSNGQQRYKKTSWGSFSTSVRDSSSQKANIYLPIKMPLVSLFFFSIWTKISSPMWIYTPPKGHWMDFFWLVCFYRNNSYLSTAFVQQMQQLIGDKPLSKVVRLQHKIINKCNFPRPQKIKRLYAHCNW